MALTIFEDTFGTTKVRRTTVQKGAATAEYVANVTDAVQSVVDTYRDPRNGHRFIVSLSEHAQAYSDPLTKKVVVSYKPLFDKGLKLSVAATVMLGLTLHEVGHTIHTFPLEADLARAFGDRMAYKGWGPKPFNALAYVLVNIGDDARLEYLMARDLPIARDVFPTMLHWMALNTGMVGQPMKWDSGASLQDRVNFAGRSMRYPWTAIWSRDTATRAERLWWQEWKRDYCLIADGDGPAVVAAIKVALDHLKHPTDYSNEPDLDEPGDEPSEPGEDEVERESNPDRFGDDFDKSDDEDEGEDESDEDDDDFGGQPGLSDEDEDWDDDEADEDEDGDGSGEGEDEDEDEPGEGNAESEGEPDEDGDEAESESQGSDADNGEDLSESDSDEGDEPGEGEGKGGEPGEGNADHAEVGDSEDDESEDEAEEDYSTPVEFDAHSVQGDLHHLQDDNRYHGRLLQEAIDSERAVERVKAGAYGTAKVQVKSVAEMVAWRGRYR